MGYHQSLQPIENYPINKVNEVKKLGCNSFDKDFIKSCGVYRTSRKIMDGNVYIPENIDDV